MSSACCLQTKKNPATLLLPGFFIPFLFLMHLIFWFPSTPMALSIAGRPACARVVREAV